MSDYISSQSVLRERSKRDESPGRTPTQQPTDMPTPLVFGGKGHCRVVRISVQVGNAFPVEAYKVEDSESKKLIGKKLIGFALAKLVGGSGSEWELVKACGKCGPDPLRASAQVAHLVFVCSVVHQLGRGKLRKLRLLQTTKPESPVLYEITITARRNRPANNTKKPAVTPRRNNNNKAAKNNKATRKGAASVPAALPPSQPTWVVPDPAPSPADPNASSGLFKLGITGYQPGQAWQAPSPDLAPSPAGWSNHNSESWRQPVQSRKPGQAPSPDPVPSMPLLHGVNFEPLNSNSWLAVQSWKPSPDPAPSPLWFPLNSGQPAQTPEPSQQPAWQATSPEPTSPAIYGPYSPAPYTPASPYTPEALEPFPSFLPEDFDIFSNCLAAAESLDLIPLLLSNESLVPPAPVPSRPNPVPSKPTDPVPSPFDWPATSGYHDDPN